MTAGPNAARSVRRSRPSDATAASSLRGELSVSATLRKSAERILSLALRTTTGTRRNTDASLERLPSFADRLFACICPRRRGGSVAAEG